MSPNVAGGIATVAGAGLVFLAGAVAADRGVPWLARQLARQQADTIRYRRLARRFLHRLEVAETRVAVLEGDVAELREGIPAVWDEGFKTGRQTDEWTLVAAEVQRREREHGGGRS